MSNPPDVPTPRQNPPDPANPDIDPLGFALSRLQCHLLWIGEYHTKFLKQRHTNAARAEQELAYLTNAIARASQHLTRRTELILAGYTFDPTKKNPMAADKPDGAEPPPDSCH